MITKVLAGVLMGLLAGATAKICVAEDGAEASHSAFQGYAAAAAISAIAFVVFTFVKYPIAFVFAAIGELVVGALIAGFLPRPGLFFVANISIVGLILAWIMAVS